MRQPGVPAYVELESVAHDNPIVPAMRRLRCARGPRRRPDHRRGRIHVEWCFAQLAVHAVGVEPLLAAIDRYVAAQVARLEAWLEDKLAPFDETWIARWRRSDGDPVLGEMDRLFHERVPGAAGQAHARVTGGHFLQEPAGPELVQHIDRLIAREPGVG